MTTRSTSLVSFTATFVTPGCRWILRMVTFWSWAMTLRRCWPRFSTGGPPVRCDSASCRVGPTLIPNAEPDGSRRPSKSDPGHVLRGPVADADVGRTGVAFRDACRDRYGLIPASGGMSQQSPLSGVPMPQTSMRGR